MMEATKEEDMDGKPQEETVDRLTDEAFAAGAITVETKAAGAFTPGVVAVTATRADGVKVSNLVGKDGAATGWDRAEPPEEAA